MSDTTAEAPTTEAAAQLRPAKVWLDRITEYRQKFEKWEQQCVNLDKLYSRHERADSADREYSIFWANLEVLKPAVYARAPVPVVAPRFKDNNLVAREASEVLERSLVVNFEQADLDGMMKEVRDQFLRYARGTGKVRLAGPGALAFDDIHHTDFAHELKRTWREVGWCGHRAWQTKEQGEQRFGEIFRGVELKKKDPNAVLPDKSDQAAVWEIWDKASGNVVWFAEGFEHILDEKPAREVLAELRNFWPYPKPAFGTLVPGSLLPVPDIRQYKDQIEEINQVTARIAALCESLRLKGFYPAGMGELSDAIEAAIKSTDDRQTLIGVSSTAALGTTSFKDSVVWLPVADVLALVQGLIEIRRVLIEDVYQITGISDIVRGQSEAQETLGAQQLKSQWGSIRIRERQNELSRFARDVTRIGAEIIAENTPAQILFEMAQVQLPTAEQKQQVEMQLKTAQEQAAHAAQQSGQDVPPPQPPKEVTKLLKKPTQEDVAAFLANDRARGFTIEIETDSTIQPDEDAEKQRRIEFGTAIGGMFQQAAPIVMQAPALGPFVVEAMKFMAGGFRAGRPLEAALDQLAETIEGLAEAAAGPQEPPVDPVAMAKVKNDERKVVVEERRFNEIEKPKADLELARGVKEEQRTDEVHATEGALAAHDADLKARAQEHGEQKTAAEINLKGRAQAHSEAAHVDNLNDAREARREAAAAAAAQGAQ